MSTPPSSSSPQDERVDSSSREPIRRMWEPIRRLWEPKNRRRRSLRGSQQRMAANFILDHDDQEEKRRAAAERRNSNDGVTIVAVGIEALTPPAPETPTRRNNHPEDDAKELLKQTRILTRGSTTSNSSTLLRSRTSSSSGYYGELREAASAIALPAVSLGLQRSSCGSTTKDKKASTLSLDAPELAAEYSSGSTSTVPMDLSESTLNDFPIRRESIPGAHRVRGVDYNGDDDEDSVSYLGGDDEESIMPTAPGEETLRQDTVGTEPVAACTRVEDPPDESTLLDNSRKRVKILGGVCLVFVVLIAVVSVLFLTVLPKGDEDTTEQMTRLSVLSETLSEVSGDVIYDETSPQFAAVQWLAYDDLANLSLQNTVYEILVERYVMALFYFSTGGEDSWTNDYNFLSALPVCEWNYAESEAGVVCTEMEGIDRVSTIAIQSNRLDGTLPSELAFLTALSVLNLPQNRLHGSIPTQFGTLGQLVSLDLKFNSLFGPIPAELGRLGLLETMNLQSNALGGSLASELGDLSSLRTAILSHNSRLGGTVPVEFGQLTRLETFHIQETSITGAISYLFCSSEETSSRLDVSDVRANCSCQWLQSAIYGHVCEPVRLATDCSCCTNCQQP